MRGKVWQASGQLQLCVAMAVMCEAFLPGCVFDVGQWDCGANEAVRRTRCRNFIDVESGVKLLFLESRMTTHRSTKDVFLIVDSTTPREPTDTFCSSPFDSSTIQTNSHDGVRTAMYLQNGSSSTSRYITAQHRGLKQDTCLTRILLNKHIMMVSSIADPRL